MRAGDFVVRRAVERGMGRCALNDKAFEWQPEWAEDFHVTSGVHDDDMIEWDGLVLDGWTRITRD